MKKPRIYISCPISIPQSDLDKVATLLRQNSIEPDYWIRNCGYYDKDLINDTYDGVVFMLPNNRFNYSTHDLPVGVKKELSIAHSAGKKIYLAYKNAIGNYNIYKTEQDFYTFRGVQHTSSEAMREIREKASKQLKVSYDVFVPSPLKARHYDERLLLF